MKLNHLTDVTKVLILVATIIVVCVLSALGFKMVNEGKSVFNSSTNNFNNMTSQYSDIDLAIYNGATVQGSEVVNLINRTKESGAYLSIIVKTKANILNGKNGIEYVYEFTEPENSLEGNKRHGKLSSKSEKSLDKLKKDEDDYINTSAQFDGKVYKDANDVIIAIEFTQVL